MSKEFDKEQAAEMAHCALINFDNVVQMNPALGNHPIFRLARGQLVDAIEYLGRDVKATTLGDA